MDWTIPLRSQQADFIERLKSGHLLHCEKEGQHSELTVISDERLKQLRNFCWEMAEKYKRTSPVRDVFINNMKGKLGEEVVKARLGNFLTEVDYEKKLGGDGKVDFTLSSDSSVGIQVKARHGNIDTLRWSIGAEEVEKNTVLVCILIQEEVSEAEAKYHLVLAGFMPTSMIDTANGKNSFKINELLYGGALKGYLENLETLESDGLFIPFPKIHQEDEQSSEEIKAYAYLIRGMNREKEMDWGGAIEDYSEAISFDPKLTIAYGNRGFMRSNENKKEGALEDYTQAIRLIIHDTAELYSRRASVRLDLGDNQGAIQDSNQAIVINSENDDGYRTRATARYKIGDYQGAIEDYTEAIRLESRPYIKTYLTYRDRGEIRYEIGDYQGAIEDYTEAIRLGFDGFNYECYYSRANARYKLGDLQGAIDDYTESIQINPTGNSAYSERAITHFEIGNYRESIEDLTHLIPNKEDYIYYFFRGFARVQLGDKLGAIEDLGKSIKELEIMETELYQLAQNMLRKLQE